jgi:hypothetical protein
MSGGILEAASGIEPLKEGFADLPLSHLGTPPPGKERATDLLVGVAVFLTNWNYPLFVLGFDARSSNAMQMLFHQWQAQTHGAHQCCCSRGVFRSGRRKPFPSSA